MFARLVDGSVNKCDVKMVKGSAFQFFFICDTAQGPLLSYRRPEGNLEVGEQLDIIVSNKGYIHFTIKDSNFNKSGDESNANNIDGAGFIMFKNEDGVTETYPINRFTYYTNGNFKECYFKTGMKAHVFTVYTP